MGIDAAFAELQVEQRQEVDNSFVTQMNKLCSNVIATSDLRERMPSWLIPFFFLPVVLWLGSLFYATRVFVPQVRLGADIDDFSVDAWLRIRDVYTKTLDVKLALLHRSHWLLISSFVIVLVPLILLAFLPAASAPGPTEVIILTPTPSPVP